MHYQGIDQLAGHLNILTFKRYLNIKDRDSFHTA